MSTLPHPILRQHHDSIGQVDFSDRGDWTGWKLEGGKSTSRVGGLMSGHVGNESDSCLDVLATQWARFQL